MACELESKGTKMKRILIALLALLPLPAVAEIKYDAAAKKFFSKGARKNVDQAYYHRLVVKSFGMFKEKTNYKDAWVEIFIDLKLEDSPTSLRLLDDLKKFLKTIKNEAEEFARLDRLDV